MGWIRQIHIGTLIVAYANDLKRISTILSMCNFEVLRLMYAFSW